MCKCMWLYKYLSRVRVRVMVRDRCFGVFSCFECAGLDLVVLGVRCVRN